MTLSPKKTGYNRQFSRRIICDLDCEHPPGSSGADFIEMVRLSPDDPAMRIEDEVPFIKTGVAGHQKAGGLSLAWRDHIAGEDVGMWTVPGVLGVKFQDAVKAGDTVAWHGSSSGGAPGVLTVCHPTSGCSVPAGIALRDQQSATFGPIAHHGYHWVPHSSHDGDGYKTGQGAANLYSLSSEEKSGAARTMLGQTASPFAHHALYRKICTRDGYDLIYVNVSIDAAQQTSGAWDTYSNVQTKDILKSSAFPIYSDENELGLSTQLFVVDGRDEQAIANRQCGLSGDMFGAPVITHLSLRLGARFYANAAMKGPLKIYRAPKPPGWLEAPLFWVAPIHPGELGCWVPCYPPPESTTTTVTITEHDYPENEEEEDKGKDKETTTTDPVVTPSEGSGGSAGVGGGGTTGGKASIRDAIESYLGEMIGWDPKKGSFLDSFKKWLSDQVNELVAAAVKDALKKINEKITEIQKELQGGGGGGNLQGNKGCNSPPNAGGLDDANGNPSQPGGSVGEPLGLATPMSDNPAKTGGSAGDAQGVGGGPHSGGVHKARGLGQAPIDCGGTDEDPPLDDSKCTSSVSPDPFPSVTSGGMEVIPGRVNPPGSVLLGGTHFDLALDGPATNVVATDRAGQLWTMLPGSGNSPTLVTWDAAEGAYFVDLWQTDYIPVWGTHQTENAVAGIAAQAGMETNRHGQIVDWGWFGMDELKASFPNPVSGDTKTMIHLPGPISVDKITAVLVGGSSPSADFSVMYAASRSGTGTDVVGTPQTVTNTTTGANYTSLTNPDIPAERFVWVDLSNVSGSPDEFHVTVKHHRTK